MSVIHFIYKEIILSGQWQSIMSSPNIIHCVGGWGEQSTSCHRSLVYKIKARQPILMSEKNQHLINFSQFPYAVDTEVFTMFFVILCTHEYNECFDTVGWATGSQPDC